MQLPIHVIAGIIIQAVILKFFMLPPLLSWLLIIIFAFASHFVLDLLAKSTYHPPDRIHDDFWLYWHIFAYGSGFLLILIFIWEFWLGIIFANLFDIWDWLFLRKIAKKKNIPEWGKKYYLHPIKDRIQDKFFYWMPNLNYQKIGILPELFIISLWFILILLNFLNQL